MSNVAFSGCPRINFREEQWRKSIFKDQNIIISPKFLDLWKTMCCINHLKSFLTMNSQWIFNADPVFITAVSQNCVSSSNLPDAFPKKLNSIFHFMKGCCISQNDQEEPGLRWSGPLVYEPIRAPTRFMTGLWCDVCPKGALLGSSRSSPGRAAACVCVPDGYI